MRTVEDVQKLIDDLEKRGQWLYFGLLVTLLRCPPEVRERFGSVTARGWITKNGKHIFIDDTKGSSGSGNSAKALDKSGKSGIIKAESEKAEKDMLKLSSKFVNPDDDLYKYADRIPPEDGFGDIVCHGDSDSLLIEGFDGEEWHYSGAESAELIRNSNEFKGNPIRLISCQTGAKENGVAQQIADSLGVAIKAPTEAIYVNSNGDIFITDNDILARLWNIGEDVKQTGEWKLFNPKKR